MPHINVITFFDKFTVKILSYTNVPLTINMRLASPFIQPILHNKTNKICKSLYENARGKHQTAKKLEETCPSKKSSDCVEPCKVPRKSIWSMFCGKKHSKHSEKQGKAEQPEIVSEEQAEVDMQAIKEMSQGKVYRTCGSGYLLQKDHIEQPESPPTSNEDELLEEMMKDASLKGQCDPMPPFQSVELRMIELNERKLHPLYKKLMTIPKRPKSRLNNSAGGQAPQYKTRSGPVLPDELPPHLKINKEMLEKKNIPFEFKKAHPPQQLLAQMVEMRNNERPKLTNKSEAKDYSKK